MSPRGSEIINELLSLVTLGFGTSKSLRASTIVKELLSRVTHGFGCPKSPGPQKSSTNWYHG
jgi:hypothetical protein